MLQLFFYHKYYMAVIFFLFVLSIICQIILCVLYRKLIYETEQMAITSNKSLRQMKRKYVNCMEMNEGVSNVTVFVDKYLQKLKVNGLSLSSMKHTSGQLVLLGVVVAGIGACRAIIEEETFTQIMPFYLSSFLGIYAYLAVSSLTDIEERKNQLRTNLVDYLENHQAKKLERAETDQKIVEEKEPGEIRVILPIKEKKDKQVVEKQARMKEKILESREDITAGRKRNRVTPIEVKKTKEPAENFSEKEQKELEVLLKEFLT